MTLKSALTLASSKLHVAGRSPPHAGGEGQGGGAFGRIAPADTPHPQPLPAYAWGGEALSSPGHNDDP